VGQAPPLRTSPDYNGRLRVYLSNLEQGGDEGLAMRNAFENPRPRWTRSLTRILPPGKSDRVRSGFTINPSKDYIEVRLGNEAPKILLGDLLLAGNNRRGSSNVCGTRVARGERGSRARRARRKEYAEARKQLDLATNAQTKRLAPGWSSERSSLCPGKAAGSSAKATT